MKKTEEGNSKPEVDKIEPAAEPLKAAAGGERGATTAAAEKDGPVEEGAPESPPQPDYFTQLLQLKAEFENYRKRIDRERPEYVRLGKAQLWEKLLPVYDVLLQAHEQVLKLSSAGAGDAKPIVAGLELVFKEFTRFFESEGIRPIETIGKPYSHEQHEVLGTVDTDAQPEGMVVEELQRGYTWQGRVLRTAKVRIAKAKAQI